MLERSILRYSFRFSSCSWRYVIRFCALSISFIRSFQVSKSFSEVSISKQILLYSSFSSAISAEIWLHLRAFAINGQVSIWQSTGLCVKISWNFRYCSFSIIWRYKTSLLRSSFSILIANHSALSVYLSDNAFWSWLICSKYSLTRLLYSSYKLWIMKLMVDTALINATQASYDMFSYFSLFFV